MSRERRAKQLKVAAEEAVALRRGVNIATLSTMQSKQGLFKWVPEQLKAGQRGWMVYNTRKGPFSWSNGAMLHLGYDNWYKQDKQVGKGGGCWGGREGRA